jgi:hypothetical protein
MASKGRLRSAARTAAVVVTAAAVIQEMRRPPKERTWHGRVAGIVPYDFRPPTVARLRRSLWDPDHERLITEQAWGVGWAVNVGRLARVLRG